MRAHIYSPSYISRPVKLVKQVEDLKQQKSDNPVTILREPKGPDGTAGFDQNR